METETPNSLSHFDRIRRVKRYIRRHLDEPLPRERLAAYAGYSIPHFHRIFRAHVGESLSAYVRRARLERAAGQLSRGESQITEIAIASGYETPSAFNKAFKQLFGLNPSEFRELSPTAAAHLVSRRYTLPNKEHIMEPIEIRTWPEREVYYARATEVMTSPAFQTANLEASNQLWGEVGEKGLMPDVRHCVALYPDEVDIGQEVRFDLGVIFTDGIRPEPTGGMAYQSIPAGRFAVFLHTGPYDTLWHTWNAIYRDWLPASGASLRDALPFEDYVDDPSQVEPEVLRTEIYVPIE